MQGDPAAKPTPPAIPPLGFDQLPAEVQAMLKPRVERLGYLGDLIAIGARQPAVLLKTAELAEAIRAVVDQRTMELVALAVSAAMDNRYEQYQHEQLCARLGFDYRWIEAAVSASPMIDAPFSQAEIVVKRLATAVVERAGRNVTTELGDLLGQVGLAQGLAILQAIAYFIHGGVQANALGLTPPVGPVVDAPA